MSGSPSRQGMSAICARIDLLERLRSEIEYESGPQTADMVEGLQQTLAPILEFARAGSTLTRVNGLVAARLQRE